MSTFESSIIPDLLYTAARSSVQARRLQAAADITAHFLRVTSPEHPRFADVQALADKLADGSIARDFERQDEQAAVLAAALAEKRKLKRAKIQRRRLRQEKARKVPALLADPANYTQTDIRRMLDITDGRQWSKILRMAMASLGYPVSGEPNAVVTSAMYEYRNRQRINRGKPE